LNEGKGREEKGREGNGREEKGREWNGREGKELDGMGCEMVIIRDGSGCGWREIDCQDEAMFIYSMYTP
jgi:hypothetical protein